jgi:hypothetical protein
MITNSAAIIDEGRREEEEEEEKKELQLEKKIAIATDGIQQQYFANQLRGLTKTNIITIIIKDINR